MSVSNPGGDRAERKLGVVSVWKRPSTTEPHITRVGNVHLQQNPISDSYNQSPKRNITITKLHRSTEQTYN